MKRLALFWGANASQQLTAIHGYIAQDSVAYADALLSRLLERAGQAAEFPNSGRSVLERPGSGLRELVGDGYRLVYLIQGLRVVIIAVLHSRHVIEHPIMYHRDQA